ncbi:MAG: TniB family NTP-binding protein [Candidatus Helarchaeota archaeon]
MIKAPSIHDLTSHDHERRKRVEQATEILTYQAWFEYNRARQICDEIDVAFLQALQYHDNPDVNSEVRPLSLFISGEINTGKTTLVIKYMNYCKLIAKKEGIPFSRWDILYYETPVRVTLKRMFSAILETFGIEIHGSALRNTHTDVLIDRIIKELKSRKVRLLFIDEIQNLIKADLEDKKDIFNGFKKLTNQSQTRIILIGTPEAFELFHAADWVEERFRPLNLPAWEINEEYLDLLYSIYKAYGDFLPDWDLTNKDGKINPTIAKLLHKLSRGRLGKLIQIVRYGAVHALLQNRTNITEEDYKTVFHLTYEIMNGKIAVKNRVSKTQKPVKKKRK